MRRAGFWLRAVALGVDAVAAMALALALQIVLHVALADSGRLELVQYVYDLAATGAILAYSSSEVWARRSPGKVLLGLVIAYPDGLPADRWTLFLRWSTKFSPYLVGLVATLTLQPTLLAYLAGFMMMVVMVGCLQALDERKRAWHDEWSRTAVFRRRRSDVVVPAAAASQGAPSAPGPASG